MAFVQTQYNHYDFNLLTLLVVDEYGEGILVGWMISNREDMLVIVYRIF